MKDESCYEYLSTQLDAALRCPSNSTQPPGAVVAWTGGSIVGSVDDLKDLSMSLEEWTEGGKQVADQSALPGGDDL